MVIAALVQRVRHGSRTLSSSIEWCEHFRRSGAAPTHIAWERGAEITPAERAAIARSVQTFQLGETGEGRHLIRAAEAHARMTGDAAYVTAIRLFVAEEQRHARDLGRFLDAAGIPRLKSEWTDVFFRRLRHLAGLELTISVLLTAELLSNVYYAALRDATRSEPLRRLCSRILKDEVEHVRFQCERLALLRRYRRRSLLAVTHGLSWILCWGTACVVWWGHRPVFRSAGLTLRDFRRKVAKEYQLVRHLRDPSRFFPV